MIEVSIVRFIKILRQDLSNIFHNPTLIFSNTILPLVLIGVLGFITKSGFGDTPVNSFDYYGINMMIFSVGMIAITATNAFMEERIKKGNFRIAYAPIRKSELYLSKILSSYLICAICYDILVPLCQYILHLNMGGENIFYFILLLNILGFCGSCFGIMFCCIFKQEEQANAIMQIPLFIALLLGGVLFQVHRLGDFVNNIAKFSPIKWIADCSYQIIFDNNFQLFIPTCLKVLGLSVIFIFICQLLFKPEKYL